MDALEHLVRAPPVRDTVPDLATWLARLEACPFEAPIDRAIWGGFEADRLGFAFVGGYSAALARLARGLPRRLSLAATESGGAHPRAIETRLEGSGGPGGPRGPRDEMRLHGVKTFATLASVAEALLVVASCGHDVAGKNRLALVLVPTNAPGLTIEDRPPTPFAPEVPHARVTLADVPVREHDVLPGDGYATYLKPFRTIEDTCVLAATLGFLIRMARAHGFAPSVVERALALVVAIRSLGGSSPSDPVTHLALAGAFEHTRQLIASSEAEWAKADPVSRAMWQRDLPLLLVAETVRTKRTESAWKTL
jgi:alkylation response protein AidB-like acyl-CoA dehydrogenase